ncbi:MAG: class I SAM-dependent methyltransferase [Desulfoprunum sp.]|nr:class I SAM-dependent methyltransferase [Desulfoprunum sp.]
MKNRALSATPILECERKLYEMAVAEGHFTSVDNIASYTDSLFKWVNFADLTVLDIGAGRGFFSLAAACRGARTVISLEPEADGSTTGVSHVFERFRERLKLDNVVLQPCSLSEFEPGNQRFDVVLLHHSINHLNEDACMQLRSNPQAYADYLAIFQKIHALSNPNAHLIVSDCARLNLYPLLGLHNRYVPTIEWHKHQDPLTWSKLLRRCGFDDPVIRWDRFGRYPMNRFTAFFFTSLFCLTMKRI